MSPKNLLLLQQLLLHAAFGAVTVMATSNSPFSLEFSRVSDDNVITLRCLSLTAQAGTFYLNETALSTTNFPRFVSTSSQPGAETFRIDRSMEGIYSCGNVSTKSNSIALIAYPDRVLPNRRPPVYEIVGNTARLDCSVQPGALLRQYAVTWYNGTQRVLYRQPLPPSSQDAMVSVDPRYRLDPTTLSLLIDNVEFSDSYVDYHCELRVRDPNNTMSVFTYEVARSVNISLRILIPPTIILEPKPGTKREGQDVTFTCKAHGYPLPDITWRHNGYVIREGHPNYFIDAPTRDTLAMTTSSSLTIRSVSVEMSGEVECLARSRSISTPPITLPAEDSATTSLTVLGAFTRVDILISKQGDIIYFFELPFAYTQPIRIFLEYTNADNPEQEYNRTTGMAFLNTTSIQYVERSSSVVYDRFKVRAAIVSGRMQGEMYKAPKVYDMSQVTLCDSAVSMSTTLAAALVPTGFLFVLCVLLTVAIVVIVSVSGHIIWNIWNNKPGRIATDGGGGSMSKEQILNNSTIGRCLYGNYIARQLRKQKEKNTLSLNTNVQERRSETESELDGKTESIIVQL